MTPAQLSTVIRASVQDAVGRGELHGVVPAGVPVRRSGHDPRQWSSNAALRVGDQRASAVLADRLRRHPAIARVDVAGPGFLNITVDGAELAQLARTIVHDHAQPRGDHARDDRARTDHVRDDQARTDARQPDPGQAHAVRFAHARLCALIQQAADHGVTRSAFVPGLLSHDTETLLLMALADDQPGSCVLDHLALVAGAFGDWYAATRLTPRGLDPVTDLHRTRLWLADATRIVLADGLHRLGLTAPEHL